MNVYYLFPGVLVLAAACGALNAQAANAKSITFDAQAIKPTLAENTAIRRSAADDIREFSHPRENDWIVTRADLNDDGHPDLLVQYTHDSSFCGSLGCSGVIVMATPAGYATRAITLPNFMGKLDILDARHHGMHDLRFDDARYVFRWDGREYR